jgi:hypothetical protein
MGTARKPGESFDAYRLRLCKEKREERLHVKGVMVFVSTEPFKRDGVLIRRTRQFIAPPKIKATKVVHRSSK